jgi:hypothetical protein
MDRDSGTSDDGPVGTTGDDSGSGTAPEAGGGHVDSGGGGGGSEGGVVDAGPAIGPGSASCSNATVVPLTSEEFKVDLQTDTTGAPHSIGAPCTTDGGEMFFALSFSKPVLLYADTFGASYPTVLYLLDESCTPLSAPTMAGDAICSAGACGSSQSQIVALLYAGDYELGVSGAGAAAGPVNVHLQWALAPSGALTQLPQGSSTQSGTTVGGGGNIDGLGSSCQAAGPEDGFWWTSCPADSGGTLHASLCGGATFETVLEAQLPGASPYACGVDSCGLQSSLTTDVPAGAGLRVLSVEGQSGSDYGPYSMTATRP